MRGICALENPDQAVLDRIIAKLLIPTVDGTVASTSTATVDPDTGAAVAANTPNGKLVTIGSRRFPGAALRAERATTGTHGAISSSTGLSINTPAVGDYPTVRTIVEDGATSGHRAFATAVALTDGVNYVLSAYIKRGNGTRNAAITATSAANAAQAFINFDTGAVTPSVVGNAVVVRSSARRLSTGYWFVQMTYNSPAWGTSVFALVDMVNEGVVTYAGDGVSSLKTSAFQNELGEYATMPLAWDGSAGVSRIAQLNSWNQALDTSVGAVYARVLPYARSGTVAAGVRCQIYDGTTSNGWLRYEPVSQVYEAGRIDSVPNNRQVLSASIPASAGSQLSMVQRWDAASNRITNAGTTVSSGAPAMPFTAEASIVIGNIAALGRAFEGHVFLALTRPGLTLTDAEISYLDRYVRIN